ncbi:MAG TPA: hypothetical protein VHJ20_03405 [Polyangia bacterium]|nr:hypothetical protein [Polyangia bacterium]
MSRPREPGAYCALAETAEIVFEMLDTLETVTVAGQQYLMTKVVDVLRRDDTVPVATLEALGREAGRMVPDVGRFTARVARVVEAALLP